MEFRYRNAKGEESVQQLKDGWTEEGKYLKGYSLTEQGPRTFLIFRVLDYLNGSEELLREPFQQPPEKPTLEVPTEVHFTGFPAAQKARLEALASAAGMTVVKSVTLGLTYLCTGPNASAPKIATARARSRYILSEPDLKALLATGVLPDCDREFL